MDLLMQDECSDEKVQAQLKTRPVYELLVLHVRVLDAASTDAATVG